MNNEAVQLPTIENGSIEEKDIVECISGENVQRMLINKKDSVQCPNYVLDFSLIDSLWEHQVRALENIISENGDVYIYLVTKDGLVELGKGKRAIIDNIIQVGTKAVFGDNCKIYKDVEQGKQLQVLDIFNIEAVRLNL